VGLRAAKTVLWIAALAPLGVLGWRAATGHLGANPIEFITRETGTWTLRLVVATLLITPLRHRTGWNGLIRLRRLLGLFAFFYGTLHAITYLWLDQFF
jgi:sulfoxide reductase heme-binding subunit YedZ